MPALLPLLAAAALPVGSVTLDLPRWEALQPDAAAEELLPAHRVAHRDVTVTLHDGTATIQAAWTLEPGSERWFAEPILSPEARPESVTWNGRPARAHALRRGTVVIEALDGPATLRARATLPWDGEGVLPLHLLPASRGSLTVRPPAGSTLRPVLLGAGAPVADTTFWTGAAELGLRLEPPPPADPAPVVLGELALGLTVHDAHVEGRARVRVVPRRGRVDRIVLRHEGLGDDLRVDGPDLAGVERDGDRLVLKLREPTDRRATVELSWTASLPPGTDSRATLPRLRIQDVVRSTDYLQLARRTDREVLPDLEGRTLPRSALPDWADRLVQGRILATWGPRLPEHGTVAVLTYEPAERPPALVAEAEYTAAVSPEGRVLVRARYSVRSDRAPALLLTPPPGARLLAVRVRGRSARPLQTADGRWRLPIPRSVESVDGLVAFPVELAWLSEDRPWTRHEVRSLPLPVLDAPVAVQRATVHLPPGWAPRRAETGEHRVERFSRGGDLRFGFGTDEESDRKADQAQAYFDQAVAAWQDNRFSEAQQNLDALSGLGARNEDVTRLQGNLDVIQGEKTGGLAESRVREQAKARAAKQAVEYDKRRRKAEEAYRRGEYEDAEEVFKDALSLGRELAALEPKESKEVAADNAEIDRLLRESRSARLGLLPEAEADLATADSPPPPPWPEAEDEDPPEPEPQTEAERDLARLDGERGRLRKFDYGHPELDTWGGLGGIGAFGAGHGGGGYGIGSGSLGGLAGGGKGTALPVVAATRSVPIPRLGRPLLFQRLLIPAGADASLTLRARRAPRSQPGGPT